MPFTPEQISQIKQLKLIAESECPISLCPILIPVRIEYVELPQATTALPTIVVTDSADEHSEITPETVQIEIPAAAQQPKFSQAIFDYKSLQDWIKTQELKKIVPATCPLTRRPILKIVPVELPQIVNNFMLAIREGNITLIKLWLKKHAPVNFVQNGRTPLEMAVIVGRSAIVKRLLKAGAQVNQSAWRNPLSDFNLLYLAALKNAHRIFKQLVKAGARLDECNTQGIYRGMSLLQIACRLSHLNVVIKLISYGVDVNQVKTIGPCRGMTPLYIATKAGHSEVITILLANGADVNKQQESRVAVLQTPLHAAVANNNAEIINMLLAYGTDIPQDLKLRTLSIEIQSLFQQALYLRKIADNVIRKKIDKLPKETKSSLSAVDIAAKQRCLYQLLYVHADLIAEQVSCSKTQMQLLIDGLANSALRAESIAAVIDGISSQAVQQSSSFAKRVMLILFKKSERATLHPEIAIVPIAASAMP